MGTMWKLTVWDKVEESRFETLCKEAEALSQKFDATYSRFIKTSFVWQIAETKGVVEVPREFMEMLNWYRFFYAVSGRALTPTIGYALSDMGYDAEYSLHPAAHVRKVPDLFQSVEIVDDSHILLKEHILFDVGALGKGYFVDVLYTYFLSKGLTHFLVDGSGDVRYCSPNISLRIGLEDPFTTTNAIGVATITQGALCGSGINKRVWEREGVTYNHYIDPKSGESPTMIMATWVYAEKAVVADALASALFFVAPDDLLDIGIPFEYCIVHHEGGMKTSAGFPADVF